MRIPTSKVVRERTGLFSTPENYIDNMVFYKRKIRKFLPIPRRVFVADKRNPLVA